MAKLVGLNRAIELTRLVLQTGFIKETTPEGKKEVFPKSLCLLANAESGKTSIIEKFSNLPFVHYTNDISPKPFVDFIFPEIERGNIRFLAIPDILNCIEKNKTTRQRTINLFKSLIEEGIDNLETFHIRYSPNKKVRCGLITAITTDSYRDIKSEWIRNGFLSRVIPFSYSFQPITIEKIFQAINKQETETDTIPTKIYRTECEVSIPYELAQRLNAIATRIGNSIGVYGLRMQKNLMALCKANALLNKRKEVTEEDLNNILQISAWINYNFNPI